MPGFNFGAACADDVGVRRYLMIVSAVAAFGVAVFGVAGCGGTATTETKPARTPITAPATKARTTVAAQNAQLKQMEQQTASNDPTVAP